MGIYHATKTVHYIVEAENKKEAERVISSTKPFDEPYIDILHYHSSGKNVDRLQPDICQVCSDFKSTTKGGDKA